jgi:hypothetical protein
MFALIERQADCTLTRVCMTHNIRQRFLCDTEKCYLYGSGQGRQALRCLHTNLCLALIRILEGMLLQCRNEAQFIERGWAQVVDQATDVGHCFLSARNQVGE